MTMHRRTVPRSRIVAAVGALITLIGCWLPWFTVGGGPGDLTVISRNAFDSTGIVVFAAAIATLAILTLPYASERPVSADRWPTYAIITGIAWGAFAYRIVDLAIIHAFAFSEPVDAFTRIPGLWVAGLGLIVLSRAVYDMAHEPRRR
jgi:hypothetical protein